MDGLDCRLDVNEERIGELEDISERISRIQFREKRR